MNIVIDVREKLLFENCNYLIKSNTTFKDITIKSKNLDLGDIIIKDKDNNDILIIERKTISDLICSIKDGRYKEQKERLLHSIKNNVRKIMLIEGNNMNNFTLSTKTFNSVIINTLLRDNIHIHITKSIEDTIEFIENIILNIPKYYEDLKKEIIKR
jgi:crossover junction endonuclease MUS81